MKRIMAATTPQPRDARGSKAKVRSPRTEGRGARGRTEKLKLGKLTRLRVASARQEAEMGGGRRKEEWRPAAVVCLTSLLCAGFALALLATGCAGANLGGRGSSRGSRGLSPSQVGVSRQAGTRLLKGGKRPRRIDATAFNRVGALLTRLVPVPTQSSPRCRRGEALPSDFCLLSSELCLLSSSFAHFALVLKV